MLNFFFVHFFFFFTFPRIRNGSRLTPNILFGGGETQDQHVQNESAAPRGRNAFERHVAAMK